MCLVWLHGLVEDSAVVVVGRFSLLSWFALLSFQSIFSDDSLIRFGLFEMLEALSQLEEFDFVIFALLLYFFIDCWEFMVDGEHLTSKILP